MMKIARPLRTAATLSILVLSSCSQLGGIREGIPPGDGECSTVADCVAEVPECRAAKACDEGQCVFDDAIEGTSIAEQTAGDCVEVVCDGAGKTRLVPVAADAPDDGNVCKWAVCGDGFLQDGVETCEDGNDDDTDDCPTTCVPAFCGDGFVQAGVETCDDGGTSDGDPCSPTCKEHKVLLVVSGGLHTCALLSGGSVKCWGGNANGQLGLGDPISRGDELNEMGDNLPRVKLFSAFW